jgi:hypothetical protein
MYLVDSVVQRPTSPHHSAPASPGRTRWAAALRTAGVMLPLLLAFAAIPRSASAQMGGMGGGMGGMGGGGGRRGGGGGGRRGGDDNAQRGPSSSDVEKQIKEMGSLDKALDGVPDLDRPKKDSLKAIESNYNRIFESYGIAARNKIDSARAGGLPPKSDVIGPLRQEADSIRTGELAVARGVLTTDDQRGRFDRNVADLLAEEAKKANSQRRQRGSGGGMGGMGGMGTP